MTGLIDTLKRAERDTSLLRLTIDIDAEFLMLRFA
jgi:hypothetical protein